MFDLIPWKRKHSESGVSVPDPFENQLARLRDDFSALTQRMFGDRSSLTEGVFDSNWGWKFDVEEIEDAYVVHADAPGFEAADFDVHVSGSQLVIRAEHKQEEKSGNGSHFSHRSFHRSLTLPSGAEVDKIDANYKNGVLELHLPKGEAAKTKRIPVNSN
jgi:HSP20 family protein